MGKQKIIKTGHSLAVTIPSSFAQGMGIKAGQEVEIQVKPETGQVICNFSGTKQLPLSQNFIKVKKTRVNQKRK